MNLHKNLKRYVTPCERRPLSHAVTEQQLTEAQELFRQYMLSELSQEMIDNMPTPKRDTSWLPDLGV